MLDILKLKLIYFEDKLFWTSLFKGDVNVLNLNSSEYLFQNVFLPFFQVLIQAKEELHKISDVYGCGGGSEFL